MPAPIYLTDAEGWVTYLQPRLRATFAGRKPVAGQDRWCVDLAPPYRGRRVAAARGMPDGGGASGSAGRCAAPIAVAERPDGTRVLFTPYPTPILDEAGALSGAVNILIDITDQRQARDPSRPRRCAAVVMAKSVSDARTAEDADPDGRRL